MFTVIICNREGYRVETCPTVAAVRRLTDECERNPRNVTCVVYDPNGNLHLTIYDRNTGSRPHTGG
jgi:hypothetical protein